MAHEFELRLMLQQFTVRFVFQEQYNQLLFVLGQSKPSSTQQNCKDVLNLFNEFHTKSKMNFKCMMYMLQLPFKYNDQKSLAENRRDFKDFFHI